MSQDSDDIRLLRQRLGEQDRRIRMLESEIGKIPTRMSTGEGSGGVSGTARMWIRTTYGLLTLIPGLQDGDFGYASTKTNLYFRRNGVWRIVSHFSASTLQPPTPSDDGVQEGDKWYETNTGRLNFRGADGEWHCISHFKNP